MIARLGLERAERKACLFCQWMLFVETQRAATSYTKREIYIKQISQRADLKNKLLTPLATVCILSLAISSRRPCGELPHNEICKTIKIPLEREMRRINAPFNDCRLIRFDIVIHIHLNPTGLWVAFNPLDPYHDQPVTGRGAGCYKPAARGNACASASLSKLCNSCPETELRYI